MNRPYVCIFVGVFFCSGLAAAANRSSYSWDPPGTVGPDTVFFDEPSRSEKEPSESPRPGDKGYAWHCLEKGNARMLEKEYEKAVSYFAAAYKEGGPTRATAGFRLAEAYQKTGRIDTALRLIEEMEQKHLTGPREFQEAQRLKMELADLKRKSGGDRPASRFTGREWVLQLSEWRLRYVLDAMEALKEHGVPLRESAQRYSFLLDEYFLAHPEEAAGDGPSSLAAMLYGYDPQTRVPIDRWRLDPDIKPATPPTPPYKKSNKITGAEWITLIHEDKMDYVAEAMQVLQQQRVPMEKGLYAYVDALDILFTERPELPASDGVVALASLLYETEPPAREILEALRLK